MGHLEALDGAAEAALEIDAPAAEAASWAAAALAAEPLRESSVLLLVRALAAAGNQAGALAAFDQYRDRLAAEIGLEPTLRASEIRQQVLAAPDRTPAADVTGAGLSARPPGPAFAGRASFLGREQECSAISAAAAGNGPRVVLITGASGIGKSALLAEAARRADVPVLSAQAFAPDQHESWSLARRLLAQACRLLTEPLAAILPDPEASALAEMVPGLTGPSAAPGGLDEQDRREFALQGAVRLVAAVARPRCLVVADDLQWADPASLTLLGLVLRRLDGVSLAAAHQPDASPGFDPAIALGIPAAHITGITLGPLPAGAVRGLFGDQLLAGAVLRQAAGPRSPSPR